MRHVVKRKRHKEVYNQKKVYLSVYAAALNCGYESEKAEKLAKKVSIEVTNWIADKPLVESKEIRRLVAEYVDDFEVVRMYNDHMDIC